MDTRKQDIAKARARAGVVRIGGASGFWGDSSVGAPQLGASGAIEAVYSVLAIREGLIFPNLRFETQMKELPFAPVTELQHKELRNVMSNSFGFGGNCSSLIFSKVIG